MAATTLFESNNTKIERFENYGPAGRLTLRSVKLMGDGERQFCMPTIPPKLSERYLGALGSWGAALIEPYTDKPDHSGTLLYSTEEIATRVGRYWDDFQVVSYLFLSHLLNNTIRLTLTFITSRRSKRMYTASVTVLTTWSLTSSSPGFGTRVWR